MRQRRFTRGVFLFAVFNVAYMTIAIALGSTLVLLGAPTGGDNGLFLIGLPAMALAVVATTLFARRVPRVPTWVMILFSFVVLGGMAANLAVG